VRVLLQHGLRLGSRDGTRCERLRDSKFGIRAFGECLCQELRDIPDVDAATMLPQAVDTPIFRRAANFAGRPARPISPLLDPETVAGGILRCAESPSERSPTPAQVGPSSSCTPSPLPCTAALSRRLSRLGTMPTAPPANRRGNPRGDGQSPRQRRRLEAPSQAGARPRVCGPPLRPGARNAAPRGFSLKEVG
jgi:hypothetical protein